MIKANEIILRRYQGRECVQFAYDLFIGDNEFQTFTFDCLDSNDNVWKISTIFPGDIFKSEIFQLPKKMNLEMVTAIGLNYFKLSTQQEIQINQLIEFSIGKVIQGMYE